MYWENLLGFPSYREFSTSPPVVLYWCALRGRVNNPPKFLGKEV